MRTRFTAIRGVVWAGVMGAGLAAGAAEPPYEARASEAVARVDRVNARGSWRPSMDELARHEEAPEWFLDAKFGIYFHWGVYSVPEFDNEWYPRNMHIPGSQASAHHTRVYGEPSKFGYHDFVPKFTAEHFDAGAWAELFQRAGARFAGPVFEHHDGFAMWKSELTPWTAAAVGPRRDIAGEMERAIRARGMKFIATFHHGFNGQFTEKEGEDTGYYPRHEGWPTASEDPGLRLLYGNLPQKWSRDLWLGKLAEAIDGYRPDLIWFDFCLARLPKEYQEKFLAYYFNRAEEWGASVVVTCKNHNVPPEIAVEDFEKGRADRLTPAAWLTDDTISLGSWCYTQDLKIKPARDVIHVLADIVSKNGNLLLNISPRADGTIPADQQEVLGQIGGWLAINGEAIYGTRPWLTAGEGPTRLGKGGHFVQDVKYTPADVRYTRSKDGAWVYVIVLGWPEPAAVTLRSVKASRGSHGEARLLGSEEPVEWSTDEDSHVVLRWPADARRQGALDGAYAVKLPAEALLLHEEALAELHPELTLEASRAIIDGEQARLEDIDGQQSIGYWDRASEAVHWLVRISEPGKYRVRARVAAQAPSRVAFVMEGGQVEAEIASTGSWRAWRTVELGEVTFRSGGVHHVWLQPLGGSSWRAINVRRVMLVPE